jgi:glutathione peroxidase
VRCGCAASVCGERAREPHLAADQSRADEIRSWVSLHQFMLVRATGVAACATSLVAGLNLEVPGQLTRRAALALPAAALASPRWLSPSAFAEEDGGSSTAPPAAAEVAEVAAAGEAVDAAADAPIEAAPTPPAPPPGPTAFDFDVPFRGEPRDIKPFLGKATVIVNVKFDDPITLDMMPALTDLHDRYSKEGLHVLSFPTDQGWFEADDDDSLRLKFKQVYGFGRYPSAVVLDKADLLGTNAQPIYRWITATEKNPWGVERIVFNYEKFLVDAAGHPLRRYPRKFPPSLMEADVRAALAGEPLPPPSAQLIKAWEDAKREAIKSEYAFKPGLNCTCCYTPPRARGSRTRGRASPRQAACHGVRPSRALLSSILLIPKPPSPCGTDYKKGSPAS